MAHFRAVIKGNKKDKATRLGTADKGVQVEAQSWDGKVVVTMFRKSTQDYVRIELAEHEGAGHVPSVKLYEGPVNAQLGYVIASLEHALIEARRRA